jgi:3-oxoacyl-(acyl-carrier-protein) synthase
LVEAIAANVPIPIKELVRPGSAKPLRVRQVPPPSPRPAWIAHARLRRTSPITQYSVAAALEALGDDATRVRDGSIKLGVIVTVMSGCVNYSRRFYDEALRDPATASPLVFPETVFNAPSSHIAALLGTEAINYTLVGDPGTFVQGLALAADWLLEGTVDACVVAGSEEIDWATSNAFQLFSRQTVLSDGAGAVYLKRETANEKSVKLVAISDSHLFVPSRPRVAAIAEMRRDLAFNGAGAILVDGLQDVRRYDAPEEAAWRDWKSRRLSPKKILGEGLMAAAAWQTVLAVNAVREGADSALLSVVGTNQQAIGAVFGR